MSIDTNLDHDTSNTGALTRERLEREIRSYGQAYGKGANSRPAMAVRLVEAANKLTDVSPDDATALYTFFQKGAAASRGVEYTADSEKSFKVQVSKAKRFLTLGELSTIDGIGMMDDAVQIIEELSRMPESPLRGSAYDNMVNVARRQIAQPTVQLTKSDLYEMLSQQAAEKSDLDKVIDVYKRVYRLAESLAETGVDVSNIDNAVTELAAQITAMDGELPPMTKIEQKKIAAIKVLASQGIQVNI